MADPITEGFKSAMAEVSQTVPEEIDIDLEQVLALAHEAPKEEEVPNAQEDKQQDKDPQEMDLEASVKLSVK